ncbi:PAS domain-containing protein [Algoriphagus aquimarinus]|uniref:PAS domain-containing protein n=1 Tax=Algoriphagus aquimarinus TaxID=237018 RepID=UPI0030DBBBC2
MDINHILLQKQRHLAELSSAHLNNEASDVSYQQLCDDLHELSGAAYTVINLLTHDHKATKTVAISEPAKNLQKALSIFGFNLIGKEWPVDEFAIKAMKTTRLINQGEIGKASPHITYKIGKLLKNTFGIGNIYSVGLFRKEQVMGTLVLVMKKGEVPAYPELVEIFAQQVGAHLYQIDQKNKLAQEKVSNLIITNKLTQSETLLRGLFELSPFGIILNDFETGNFVEVNDALLKQIGYSREELFVLTFLEVTPKEYTQQEEIQLELLNNTGRYGPYEKEYIRKDGTRYPVVLNGMITLDAKGKKMIWSIVEDISERKRAESELREKHGQFVSLINNIPGISYRCKNDQDWTMLFISDAVDTVSGYRAEDLLHNKRISYAQLILPEDKERVAEAVVKALEKNETWEVEYRIRHKNGALRWVSEKGNAVSNTQGEVNFLDGFIIDITDKLKAENSLKQSEARFRQITDTIQDVFYLYNIVDKKLEFFSPNCHQILGIAPEFFFEGKKLQTFVHKDDKAKLINANRDIYAGIACEIEYRVWVKKELRWLNEKSFPIKNEKGNTIKISGIVTDITAKKRTEAELDAKRMEIQDITNAVNESSLVSITDKKGDIVKVNSKFCEVSGFTEAELIGQNHRLINSSYHDKIFWRGLWRTISRGKVWKGEIKNRAKDGTEYWVASVINPIFDENGIINHYLSIRQDITERKKAELDLVETQQKLNSIFTEMEDVVWSTRLPDYMVLFMTPSAIDLFGVSFEDLMADSTWWEKLIHPEDKAVIGKIYKQLSNNGSFEEEYRIISLDSKVKWISNKGKIITDKNGVPRRLDGYMRNISAYKFADQRLRNSEANLKEAHSIAKLGHWELDLVVNRLNWSDSVFEIFEIDPKKFDPSYEEFLKTIHPGDREALNKAYTDSLANKTPYAMEHRLPMPDGRVKWLRENCRTEYDADGKALSSVGIVQDITESKVAELELLKTKDLLVRTNTVARVGGWEVDLVNNAIYWTEITKEIHEVSPDFNPDLVTSINFYKEGESRNKITKLVSKALETGEGFDVELQIITAQDREVWVRAIGQAEFENNKCIRLYGTFQDIDKSKKAEELIIRQNQFKQLIAEISGEFVKSDFSTTDAVINKILQKCGVYFDVDRCFLFQISSEEHTFSNTHDWHREGTESMQHRVQNVPLTTFPWFVAKLAEQDSFIISDVAQVPAEAESEKWEWINQHMKSILFVRIDYNNQPAGVLGLSTISRTIDWTEDQVSGLGVIAHIISDGLTKDILEKGLIEAKDKAENANKAKSEFLANMSHEIRTPLNSILGFSEILLQSIHEPKAAGQLKTIQSSGRILLSLINDLLDLAKIEAGQLSLQADSVDVRAMVDEIYQMFLPQTTKKNLNLFTEFSSSFPRQVMIDDIRLKQMIVNLVGNAVKFTQQGSIKIHVDFSHINPNQSIGCLQFSVEDTGMGIAQTDLETIFESFRQGTEQSVRHYGGTGLGLSITKRLVDLMQGEISVSSQKGKGSVFTITIPDVTFVEYVKESSSKNSTEKLHFKDATILVVDDVATNRNLVADYLSDHDITLIMGTNGLEAITLAKAHQPDLILMDIRMPEMDGWEAARIIHETEDLKDIPIIAFTASIQAHETIDGNFAGLLSKPIQGKVLFDELKKYIPYDTVVATAIHSENQDEQTTQEELQAHLPYLQEHFQSTIDRLTYMMDVTEMEQLLNHLKAYAKQHKLKQLLNLTAQLETAFDQFDLDNISIELQRLSILLNN